MSTDRTQPSDNFNGEVIGHYILLNLIGRGHFADVYLGQDIRYPNRKVAIKILSTSLTAQRILTEGPILLRLDHENIVRVFEVDVEQKNSSLLNRTFIVMKREGINLRELYKDSPVPLEKVVSYVCQMAKALDYAHDQGVFHRDVKPENILQAREDKGDSGSEDKVLLSDFNIAFRPEYDTISDVQGTPEYMAPEQWDGKPCRASDLYSLGIVAYEWLYGKRPFEGLPFQLVVHHHEKRPPFEQDRVRNPAIPIAVERVLERVLAKNPAERYTTAQEFAEALAEALKAVNPQPKRVRRILGHSSIKRRDFMTVALIAMATAIAVRLGEQEVDVLTHSGAPIVASRNLAPTKHKTRLVYDKHGEKVGTVAWSPGSLYIASGGIDGMILVWDWQGRLKTRHDHQSRVLSISWSPDGKYIASVSEDGILHLWNVATGETIHKYQNNEGQLVRIAVWAATGDLAVGWGMRARVYDAPIVNGFKNPDDPFMKHIDQVNALSFSPDSTRIASASDDKTVQIWGEDKGSYLSIYPGHKAEVLSVDWAWQLDLLVSGGNDRTVQIWDASQLRLYDSYSHNGAVRAVKWASKGPYLVSGGEDAIALLWKIDKSTSAYTGHSDSVNAVTFSPDGKLIATASDDKTVHIWEV
jgi:serine/threonine protein kinase